MKLLSLIFLLAFPFVASAQSVTLAWDRAASHTNLSEFTLRWGTNSGIYTVSQSVPQSLTQATINGLATGKNYFFVVTARNVSGVESDPSNEVGYRTPGPSGLPGAPQMFAIQKVP